MKDRYAKKEREGIYQALEKGEISMGLAVKSLRKAMGLTQAKYAAVIDVDIRVLRDFEKGTGNLRTETIEKILTPLGLKLTAQRV